MSTSFALKCFVHDIHMVSSPHFEVEILTRHTGTLLIINNLRSSDPA